MIKEPYIGMPIIMGGRCDTAPAKPEKPPQSQNQNQNQSQNQNSETSGGASGGAGSSGSTSGGSGGAGGASGGSNNGANSGASSGANVSGFDAMYLGSLPIAMAYTPMQQWKTTYSPEKGLARGTIFPELDLPFEGRTVLSRQTKGGQS